MGGIALLALGGIVALAAAAASRSSGQASTTAPPPPPTGYPPPPDPPQSHPAPAPRPVPAPAPEPSPYVPSPPPAPSPAPQPGPAPAPGPVPAPVPSPAPAPSPAPVDPGIPGVSPATNTAELVQRLREWLATDPPPAQVELVAVRLEEAGMRQTASQLRAWAQRAREQGSATPPGPTQPAPSPGVPEPAPTPAPAPAPIPTDGSSRPDSGSGDAPRPAEPAEPSGVRAIAAAAGSALTQRWTEIRQRIAAFQTAADITSDGQYGPNTRAALTYWTGRTAPRPWVGTGTGGYDVPRSTRSDGSPESVRALRLARRLFATLVSPEGSAQPQVERFQQAVRLTVDGKYGERTRAALVRHGVTHPPPAFRRSRRRRRRRNRS